MPVRRRTTPFHLQGEPKFASLNPLSDLHVAFQSGAHLYHKIATVIIVKEALATAAGDPCPPRPFHEIEAGPSVPSGSPEKVAVTGGVDFVCDDTRLPRKEEQLERRERREKERERGEGGNNLY